MNTADLTKLQEAIAGSPNTVVALDLLSVQGLAIAAELSQAFKEASEGLKIAQELRMRYLFVGFNKRVNRCVCMPLADMGCAGDAMIALRAQLLGNSNKGAEDQTAWVVVPESWRDSLMPFVDRAWSFASTH